MEYIIPLPDDFDIENYTKEVFFMFSGEKVLVDTLKRYLAPFVRKVCPKGWLL